MTRVPAMLLAATLAAGPLAADAKDLGVRGATWPVAEPDLLAQIEARLVEMERSGALARLEDEARDGARRMLEEPEPAPGIVPARESRSRLWDPAITVARDIRTADGVLIAAAGTRVNPLERVTLARDLLFVDGRRRAEIAWALAHERPAKIVLLAGRPLALMRQHAGPSSSTRADASRRASGSGSRRAWSNRRGRGSASRRSRSRTGRTPERRTDRC